MTWPCTRPFHPSPKPYRNPPPPLLPSAPPTIQLPVAYRNVRCDGVQHCLDGSDEWNCTLPCPEAYVSCNVTDPHSPSHCIPHTWLCDGENDCLNATDEQSCHSASKYSCILLSRCTCTFEKSCYSFTISIDSLKSRPCH